MTYSNPSAAVKLALVSALLAGCAAGSKSGLNAQAGAGGIDLDVQDAATGIYRVTMFNVRDFDWDIERKEDRQKVVSFFLDEKCKQTETLTDTSVQVGTYGLGHPRIKRVLTVKCLPR